MKKKSLKHKLKSEKLTTGPRPSQEEMGRLIGLLNSNQLILAESEAERLIERYKRVPELYNMRGAALIGLRKFEELVDCYLQILNLQPDNVGTYINLGNVYLHLNKFEEAAQHFQHALKLDPGIPQAHNNLGAALAAQGRFAEAVKCYRQAIHLQQNYGQAYNNLGNALRDIGELDEANASFQRALEINPNDAEAHYNLHTLLLDPIDLSSAIGCLEDATRLQPDNTNFRFYLGMLLEYSGDSKNAESQFDALRQRGSELDKAHLDAWNYIKSAGTVTPKMIGSYLDAFRIGMNAARDTGLVLEFGVRFGTTIRQIAALTEQQVHGFDSFEGLPEDWHHEGRGSYSTKGVIPQVPNNVVLHKGWFEETLPEFVKAHQEPVRFINVDCDLYSATKTILNNLAAQIVAGTVIVFDEYIGNEHWREDEFKAFQEAVADYGWKYEYLAFSLFTKQAVVRIH